MLCLLEQLPGSCFGAEIPKETEVLAKRLQGFLVTQFLELFPNPVES